MVPRGQDPAHTLRQAIDYGFAEANTVYGKIGVKCWLCKPEGAAEPQPVEKRESPAPAEPAAQ
jgi:small subunit ribosomal protein S3